MTRIRVRCDFTGWSKTLEPGSVVPSCPYHRGGCLILELEEGGEAARETVEAESRRGVAP